MLTGIASVIFPTNDLEFDKAFWATALDAQPYFDQPFYVGFKIDGRELGLDPNASDEGLHGPVSYWATEDLHVTCDALLAAGASSFGDVRDIGDGVLLVALKDPSGNVFGLLQRSIE